MRETARQSRLCNVAVYAAADAVYWEGMRIMPGPIARRAKITRGKWAAGRKCL